MGLAKIITILLAKKNITIISGAVVAIPFRPFPNFNYKRIVYNYT